MRLLRYPPFIFISFVSAETLSPYYFQWTRRAAFLSHSPSAKRHPHHEEKKLSILHDRKHADNDVVSSSTVRHMGGSIDDTDGADSKIKNLHAKKSSTISSATPRHRKSKSKQGSVSETWRLYGIATHPDDDDWYSLNKQQRIIFQKDNKSVESIGVDERTAPIPGALRSAIYKRLKFSEDDHPVSIKVVRRSLDARRKLEHPAFQYVVDVVLSPQQVRKAHLQHRQGRTEQITNTTTLAADKAETTHSQKGNDERIRKKKVLVVGAGPAGLFCALQLARSGTVEPILLDRGQPVERRGRDIGALIHRSQLNKESNFAFGEGGAGTWSDGKLTTRIGRNSANVRWILETLVEYGAPPSILWEGAPHLGTDNLVRLLRNMRHDLKGKLGVTIHFGTRLLDIKLDPKNPSIVQGIRVEQSDSDMDPHVPDFLSADAVVLATGHSARDVYETLASGNQVASSLEPKGFAVGFRIEHPQKLITKIQYGNEWGPTVRTGKRQTDLANDEFFSGEEMLGNHTGQLPVPSYRLATDKANDGSFSDRLRGVYSFCMCPGGQIVPSSTNSSEVCVNGMSFSKRDSLWANSALVVTIFPDDPILESYREKFGVMAGVEFQRDMERKAAEMGGGTNLTVPVQRVTDFIKGQVSETIPSSSYRLGVRSAPCHQIYPSAITEALRDALVNHFDAQMPGYVHPDALLHGVETRTSSPLRIARDSRTYQVKGMTNLFPAGEGAGFAGGIVSAAVDGRMVAEAVLDYLHGTDRPGRLSQEDVGGKASIGFNY